MAEQTYTISELAKEFGVKPAEVSVGMAGDQGVLQDAVQALMALQWWYPNSALNSSNGDIIST